MVSIKMFTFCKSASCPSSFELLAFQHKESEAAVRLKIEFHLKVCEFCEAEVEFYTKYPQSDENCVATEIPVALRELAEALLGNEPADVLTLNKLLKEEDEEFILKKA